MTNIVSIIPSWIERARSIRTLPSLAALVAFGSIGTAQTQQQCFVDSIPMQITNWNETVTFSKFDPALGDLQSITFTVDSEVTGSAAAENKDPSAAQITLQFQNFITLQRPDTTILTVANPMAVFDDVLGAYDGVDDFGGTSGITHGNIMAFDSEMSTSPPPASDLPLFTGPLGNPGTITLPIKATGSSFASGSGNLLAQFNSLASATVTVCYNYIGNVPPSFTSPQCGATLMASVGVPFSVQVCASDTDGSDVVTLSAITLPAGATTNPVLPANGNPVCTTVNWTALNVQAGTHTFTFMATDQHGRSTTCSFQVLVAECHLLLGSGLGNTSRSIFGHQYQTQMRVIRMSFPVTMEQMPNIRLPPNHVLWAQVLMFNPEVFPTNPEQWSQVARVVLHPDLTLTSDLFGTFNGIHIQPTTIVDPYGLTRVRFPFTIDGM